MPAELEAAAGEASGVDHVEQGEHAHNDAGVRHVEGRPGHRVDEIDHSARAGAVGQVAEGAAEEQADGQPEPRLVAVDREVADQQSEREADQDRDDHTSPSCTERHAGIARVGGVEPREDAHLVAALDVVGGQLLGRLVESHHDSGRGQRRRQAGWGHPRMRPVTMRSTMISAKAATIRAEVRGRRDRSARWGGCGGRGSGTGRSRRCTNVRAPASQRL